MIFYSQVLKAHLLSMCVGEIAEIWLLKSDSCGSKNRHFFLRSISNSLQTKHRNLLLKFNPFGFLNFASPPKKKTQTVTLRDDSSFLSTLRDQFHPDDEFPWVSSQKWAGWMLHPHWWSVTAAGEDLAKDMGVSISVLEQTHEARVWWSLWSCGARVGAGGFPYGKTFQPFWGSIHGRSLTAGWFTTHRIRMYAMIMVCHLPSIYPRFVGINIPYDWIRHG